MSKYTKYQERGWRRFRQWQKDPEVKESMERLGYHQLDKSTFMALWKTEFKGGRRDKQILDFMTHTTKLKYARTFRRSVREEFDIDIPSKVIRNEMSVREWLSHHSDISDEIKARYHAFINGGMLPSAARKTISTYYFGS